MSDEPADDRNDAANETDENAESDPFDGLAPDDDRAGDPFESLDDAASAEESNVSTGDDDRTLDDHPFSDPEEGTRKRRADPDDPLSDVDTVPGGDPFESGDWSTDSDDDSVWEDLSEPVDVETATEEKGGRRLSEVNKHSFCEQCEYFSGPPEISCANEGTEILEFLDMETVRVADCPIVEERERLEDAGTQR